MQSMKKNFAIARARLLLTTISVGLVLVVMSGALLAEDTQERFSSAAQASQALFAAVKDGNEQGIAGILGGKKELASSGDPLQDQQERATFVQKYQEMHRLVQEHDGTITLYVGAENWPFPIPLVSKNGKWFFDADAGAQEVLFRRVGRNEASAIETSQSLASGTVNSGESAGGSEQAATLVNGYYFRKVVESGKGGEKAIVIAYPAEYRSSGVMTFVATAKGVYAKDLGPKTMPIAKDITTWKADRSWKMVK